MRSSYNKVLCLLSIAMLMIVMANTGAQVQGKESTAKPDAYPAPRWSGTSQAERLGKVPVGSEEARLRAGLRPTLKLCRLFAKNQDY